MRQACDPVAHPSHYTDGIEVIDYIESKGMAEGFCRGNAIKYISRAGKKDKTKEVEDLKKAVWYLEREIARLEKLNEDKDMKKRYEAYLLNDSNNKAIKAFKNESDALAFADSHADVIIVKDDDDGHSYIWNDHHERWELNE